MRAIFSSNTCLNLEVNNSFQLIQVRILLINLSMPGLMVGYKYRIISLQIHISSRYKVTYLSYLISHIDISSKLQHVFTNNIFHCDS